MALYLCKCGKSKVISKRNVKTMHTRSCGCIVGKERSTVTHGLSRTQEYRSWGGMINRCHNPNSSGYYKYGARGIKVCDRWREDFLNFLHDVGPKPSPEHSIERKDNNSGYEPSNCKWATNEEQCNNRRSSHRIEAYGVSLTIAEWEKTMELQNRRISKRLHYGWSEFRAIFTPKLR